MKLACLAAIALLLMLALPGAAHHSYLSQATSSRVTVQGVITKVEWSYPHVIFYVDVVNADTGRPVRWTIETGSPNELIALSITRESLRVGADVTLRGAPRTNKLEVPASELPWIKH